MGNLQMNLVMPQSHVMFVKISGSARGHPAIGISSFKGNSVFRSGVESKHLFCNYLFGAWFLSAGSEMPCRGTNGETWSACKKKIRFVELPVNGRRRGKQLQLNRIAVKHFRQSFVDKLTLFPISFGSSVHRTID